MITTTYTWFHSGLLHPAASYLIGGGIALIVLALLHRDLRRRPATWRGALYLTRGGMLAILTLLLAQPNLVRVQREATPGETLVVLDDSASMFVTDEWADPSALMNLAVQLDLPDVQARDTSVAALATQVAAAGDRLAPMFAAGRDAATTIATGLPWSDGATTALRDARPALDDLQTLCRTVRNTANLPAPVSAGATHALEQIGDANDPASLLALASTPPDASQWLGVAAHGDALRQALADLETALRAEQTRRDLAFLASDDRQTTLRRQLGALTRYDLAERLAKTALAGEHVTTSNLSRGGAGVNAATAAGKTDLVKPLAEVLSSRPLTLIDGVVLFSDGGQNTAYDLSRLEMYRRRGVNLQVVGIGDVRPDPALRLADYEVPGIVAGRYSVPLRVDLDTHLPPGTSVVVSFNLAGTPTVAAAATATGADGAPTTTAPATAPATAPPTPTPDTKAPTSPSARRTSPSARRSPSARTPDVDHAAGDATASDAKGDAGTDSTGSASSGAAGDTTGDSLPWRRTYVVAGDGRLRVRGYVRIEESGFQTLSMTVEEKAGGTRLTQDFPVYVHPDRPSVLVIAERPDTLTTSLLAQRRFGIRVYPVYTFGAAANVRRGKSLEELPATPEDWRRYDLVVLRGRVFPGLNDADVTAIAAAVRRGELSLLLAPGDDPGYARAFAPSFSWDPASAAVRLDRPESIGPAPGSEHLPMLRLSGEVIQNDNRWQGFAPPARWSTAPPQTLPLIVDPTGQPAMTLGLYGVGRVVYSGLDGYARMNEWQAPDFERVVMSMAADLLTPIADWRAPAPVVGVYPPVGRPGRASLVAVHLADAQATTAPVEMTGADATAAPVRATLAGADGLLGGLATVGDAGDYTVHAATLDVAYPVRAMPSAETRDVNLREPLLRDLAAAAGGTYRPLADLASVRPAIAPKSRDHLTTQTWHTLDFVLPILLVFLLFAGLDFALRKLLGMVL